MRVTAEAPTTPRVRAGLSIQRLWTIVAWLLPGIASLGVGMNTIDLAYHLRAGAITLREGSPLARDLFTFTAAGAPWLNQQWGAQVILSWVHQAASWTGLALLRAGLISGIYTALQRACRARGSPPREAALLCVAGFLVAAPYLGLRPQLFGAALFAITILLLDLRHARPGVLWLLPPLAALWANLHGSFPLALLAVAAIEDRRDPAHLRRVLGVGAAAAAATLINPFGIRVWGYALGIATDPVISRIVTEWAPPDARTLPGAIFFLSLLAVTGWLVLRPSRPPRTMVLKLGFLTWLALLAVRAIVWWAIALPALVAEARQRRTEPRMEGAGGAVALNAAIIAALLLLGLVLGSRWPRAAENDLLRAAPVAVTRELAALGPGMRVFNAQIWGSWFEFALPENPVFVDSRIELFPGRIWDQYYDVSNGREGWQAILDRWDVAAVVADREQQAELIPRIRRDPGWRLVYDGEEGLVFLRA